LRFLALRGATRISNPRVIEFDFWLSIDEKPWADRAWLVYPDRVDGVRSLYRLSAKVSPEGGIRISTVLNISKIASRNGLWALFSPPFPQSLFTMVIGSSRGRPGWPNIRQTV
jgi:hypothetical protein